MAIQNEGKLRVKLHGLIMTNGVNWAVDELIRYENLMQNFNDTVVQQRMEITQMQAKVARLGDHTEVEKLRAENLELAKQVADLERALSHTEELED